MPEVQLERIPADEEEFRKAAGPLGASPEGAAALLITGLAVMAANPEAGRKCVSAADPSLPGSRMRFVEERLRGKEYLPASYFSGTGPENGYALPRPPLVIRFSTNPHSGDPEGGRLKLFVECSGADSPRPVTVARDSVGRWTAVEWSSLLTGIRPPAHS
jgi:hypothetical protein